MGAKCRPRQPRRRMPRGRRQLQGVAIRRLTVDRRPDSGGRSGAPPNDSATIRGLTGAPAGATVGTPHRPRPAALAVATALVDRTDADPSTPVVSARSAARRITQ